MEERLQKFMARCGVASRRKCEELIAEGLVELNGEVVREPGVKIDPARDRIRVDGKPVRAEAAAYYAHYKVKGVTTTVSDDLGRKTIMDCLPGIKERVYPVGRLDKDSEGLILLTNDGELANYIMHPAHGIEKTYRVVAEGRIPPETLEALAEKGMRLGPVLIRPTRVQLVRYDNENTIVFVSVAEGINREVRRMFAALGHEVKKLLRTRIGPVELEGMKRGATRPLTPKEIAQIRKGMAGMNPADEEARHPRGSAAARKPTGPRGRPRKEKTPRGGKPDPALAKRGRSGGSKVVVDDWKKQTGPRRPAGRKEEEAPKPLKTLRPTRRKAAPAPAAAARPSAPPARKPRVVAHPLAPVSPPAPAKRPGQARQAKPGKAAPATARKAVKAGRGKAQR